MRILKWTAAISVLLAFILTVMLYAFVRSKELRQAVFPLEYRTATCSFKCRDIVIGSTDTIYLHGIDINGPLFSLFIPRLEIKYAVFPPDLNSFTAENPDLKLRYGKKRRHAILLNNMVTKVLERLHVRNGALLYTRRGYSIRADAVYLSPSESSGRHGETMLTQGKCNFSARSGREVIKGNVHARMSRGGRVHLASSGITVMISGHPPLSLSADIDTGLIPQTLGVFKGTIKVPDVLPLLPLTVRQSSYMRRRSASRRSLSANAVILLDLKQGGGLKGMVELYPWLFPDKLAPPTPLPAKWSLDISRDFLSGNFTIEADRAYTHAQGAFRIGEDSSVEWRTAFNTRLKGFDWQGDDNHAAEGIEALIDVTISGRSSRGTERHNPLVWKAALSMDGGGLLLYPWFFDLSSMKSRITAKGTAGTRLLNIDQARLSSFISVNADDLRLDLNMLHGLEQGRFMKRFLNILSPRGRISLTGPFEEAYNLLLKDPFSAEYPMLKDLRPSGTFSVILSETGVDTHLGMDMSWKNRQVMHGLGIDALVPLAGERCNPGSISWDWIFVPVAHGLLPSGRSPEADQAAALEDTASTRSNGDGFTIEKGLLPVSACRDRFMFGPVDIPEGDGRITVKRGDLEYVPAGINLTGINLSGIKLERLINGLPINAMVSAKDISVKFMNGRFTVQGGIITRIAGGTVEQSGLWADMSGPVPRYGAEKIVFRGLDLAELSRLIGFGRVTGRIDGHITGLVISGAEPEMFDLEIRSRKVPGVKQEISVKAVRNISILGGGPGGIPLLGEFFKNFSYSRIAVSCALKNDIFTMHGLIKKDGVEYLVERGFWGGINVINQNPGGRIAFSDMLERLERISKPGKSRME